MTNHWFSTKVCGFFEGLSRLKYSIICCRVAAPFVFMNLGSEHWELPHSWKGDLKGEILEIETLKRRGSIVPMIGGMVEKLG